MIVPMKKVSLIVLNNERQRALEKLRKLGLLHIEIKEGRGTRLAELEEQADELEKIIYTVSAEADKNTVQIDASHEEAWQAARNARILISRQKECCAELNTYLTEAERLKGWGEIDPEAISRLKEKGIDISLYAMSPTEYEKLDESIQTLLLSRNKVSVKFVTVNADFEGTEAGDFIERFRVKLPEMSMTWIQQKIAETQEQLQRIGKELKDCAAYVNSMKRAAAQLQKEIEFETYATGMAEEALSENTDGKVSVAYLVGYIPAENIDQLMAAAKENAWGIMAEDPTPEDDAPTKLRNNKFVSLIYPMTDFLGSVPGYFEYDISGWFLGFIMIFFGIIFGDGGYGLLICAAAAALILKDRAAKKPVQPAFLLMMLLGASTVLWGILTCTWFGLAPELLPGWLRNISVPVISNVNADKIWHPFWTNGTAGLTTSQNVQICCFTIALIQLTVAHVKGVMRNKGSLKMLGDVGSILQLIGIYYVVLSLVVNSEVFGLDLVVSGIPVGMIAIVLVGSGFVINFVFGNYEGSIAKSVMDSLKDIVSMLLGVVNVFSDIVSYIRLWAVGLAGAAISATVNDLVSPMLGKFMLMVFVIILLVFGHGLNMILNVLSVIVHGIRLNTLEFSSHLGMTWSGHKYKPFEE